MRSVPIQQMNILEMETHDLLIKSINVNETQCIEDGRYLLFLPLLNDVFGS